MFLIEGKDRAGRRVKGRTPPATIRNDVLYAEVLPASCSLDVAERSAETGGLEVAELARLLGIRPSRLFDLAKSLKAKLVAAGGDLREIDRAFAELGSRRG